MFYFKRLFVCRSKIPQQAAGNELAGSAEAQTHPILIIPLEPPDIDFIVPF
jgi:hypothetical protein